MYINVKEYMFFVFIVEFSIVVLLLHKNGKKMDDKAIFFNISVYYRFYTCLFSICGEYKEAFPCLTIPPTEPISVIDANQTIPWRAQKGSRCV